MQKNSTKGVIDLPNWFQIGLGFYGLAQSIWRIWNRFDESEQTGLETV